MQSYQKKLSAVAAAAALLAGIGVAVAQTSQPVDSDTAAVTQTSPNDTSVTTPVNADSHPAQTWNATNSDSSMNAAPSSTTDSSAASSSAPTDTPTTTSTDTSSTDNSSTDNSAAPAPRADRN